MKRKLIIGLLILSLIAVPLFAIACEEEVTPPAEEEEEEGPPAEEEEEEGEPPPAAANFLSSVGWPGNPEVSIDLTNGFYWGKDNTLFYNEEITDLVDQVLTTLDDETRWDIADQAWTAIDALLPQIPIGIEYQVNFSTPNITYAKTHVGGMMAGPTQLVDLTISPATIKSITIVYPGGFMGGLPSIDPCDFSNGGPDIPNVFETLVNQDGNDELYGLLAEDWSWSADGLTLTVNLRHDVVFSTGDPFTSADVLFSFDRHLERNMPTIAQFSPEQGFESYEADGDYTVLFHFNKVNVQFVPQTLVNNGIISKTYYDRVGEEAYIDLPVGTGPYKIDSWAEGQYVDLVYNDKYRGEKPQIESAHFIAAPDNATRVAMLQAGEADLCRQVPGASITALEDAGFNRIDVIQPHALSLQFDLLTPDTPWQDLRVRQAINYAIDKESLAEAMIAGPILEGTWAFTTAPWYNPSLKPAYDYDLAMAQQLMEDAGYADGFTMPITYIASETVIPLADYLASALAQINITVELTALSGMPEFMPAIAAIHNYYYALFSS